MANAHYHSCVDASELRNWKERAANSRDRLLDMECPRAKQEDKERREYSLQRLEDTLLKADERIARYVEEAAEHAESRGKLEASNSLAKMMDCFPNVTVTSVH